MPLLQKQSCLNLLMIGLALSGTEVSLDLPEINRSKISQKIEQKFK